MFHENFEYSEEDALEKLIQDYISEISNMRELSKLITKLVDINSAADKIYYYTSGYPFLVSKICKIIDEDIINDGIYKWRLEYIDEAVKLILRDNNTNFESLIKNLENNKEIYNTVYNLLIEGVDITFNLDNPIINLGNTYGIFKNDNEKTKINNKIYE